MSWWDSKLAAWGTTLVLLAIGGIFSYLKPVVGIPVLVALFLVGVYLIWRASRKHATVEAPSIVASIEAEGGDWYLKIENKGGPATFESRMRIIAANGETLNLNEYTGYWETPPHREARIVGGSPKRLRVGGVLSHNQGLTMGLLLYFYDPKTDGLLLRQSTLYIVGTQTPAPPKPEFHLRITISAEPQFKNGQPVVKEYNMALDTFEEVAD